MKHLILILVISIMILTGLGIREVECNDDNWDDFDYPWDLLGEEGCDDE